jgi:hypothetical protein
LHLIFASFLVVVAVAVVIAILKPTTPTAGSCFTNVI